MVAHRGQTYGEQVGDEQAHHLAQSRVSQIPEKRIAHSLLEQSGDEHPYLAERGDQQAKGGAVDPHARKGKRDQQAADQAEIVDGNRNGRQQELPLAIEDGGGDRPQSQDQRVQEHDARQRGGQRFFVRRASRAPAGCSRTAAQGVRPAVSRP